MRKLKLAVEEAKIELTRAEETSLTLPGAFEVDGNPVDVNMVVTRLTLEMLAAPLVDRSIDVVQRLLAAHGLEPSQLGRIVLVGGPTVMPSLRARVRDVLGVPFGEGLDPMSLVAQGAAIYAATAGLDARSAAIVETPGRRVWLQYPAMSSDLTPHVIGRLVDAGPAAEGLKVKLVRSDGLWTSPEASVDAEGAFVLTVDLLPRRPNVFHVEATTAAGAAVRISPSTFTIVQGMTISDPPLSRTVGVALASDQVRVFFERGAPLPARRTFMLHTVESVARGSSSCLLKIPIVQGEMDQAHLCRLVGALEIGGAAVKASLPAGSPVEVTLELDRGGHLSARALVPALSQVFEHVAHLLVPDATPESLEETVRATRERARELRADAARRDAQRVIGKLTFVEVSLVEVESNIAAARGGDADAAQKARRTLLEIDGMLEEADADKRWPRDRRGGAGGAGLRVRDHRALRGAGGEAALRGGHARGGEGARRAAAGGAAAPAPAGDEPPRRRVPPRPEGMGKELRAGRVAGRPGHQPRQGAGAGARWAEGDRARRHGGPPPDRGGPLQAPPGLGADQAARLRFGGSLAMADAEGTVERIRDNPFYVLGVPPTAARAEIEREGQKLLGMLELGLQSAKAYATPVGPGERTADKVRRAMAELRDPERRLEHELWARLEPAAAPAPEPEPPRGAAPTLPGRTRSPSWAGAPRDEPRRHLRRRPRHTGRREVWQRAQRPAARRPPAGSHRRLGCFVLLALVPTGLVAIAVAPLAAPVVAIRWRSSRSPGPSHASCSYRSAWLASPTGSRARRTSPSASTHTAARPWPCAWALCRQQGPTRRRPSGSRTSSLKEAPAARRRPARQRPAPRRAG